LRLWSLHPEQLDPKGLVALWREALLAQAVLAGQTRGYTNHPQLDRFRAQANPLACIATYLREIAHEASRRGYSFDASKVRSERTRKKIRVTQGQLDFEWRHLGSKLRTRNAEWQRRMTDEPRVHPLFVVVEGPVESWERID
jgi:hypothetical protein